MQRMAVGYTPRSIACWVAGLTTTFSPQPSQVSVLLPGTVMGAFPTRIVRVNASSGIGITRFERLDPGVDVVDQFVLDALRAVVQLLDGQLAAERTEDARR